MLGFWDEFDHEIGGLWASCLQYFGDLNYGIWRGSQSAKWKPSTHGTDEAS
jgi:hypothetical protein